MRIVMDLPSGGGMYNNNSSPTTNCSFSRNAPQQLWRRDVQLQQLLSTVTNCSSLGITPTTTAGGSLTSTPTPLPR
ncbi:MAG: hypothetical protein R2788_08850 [Saprospiraceae bacterium]